MRKQHEHTEIWDELLSKQMLRLHRFPTRAWVVGWGGGDWDKKKKEKPDTADRPSAACLRVSVCVCISWGRGSRTRWMLWAQRGLSGGQTRDMEHLITISDLRACVRERERKWNMMCWFVFAASKVPWLPHFLFLWVGFSYPPPPPPPPHASTFRLPKSSSSSGQCGCRVALKTKQTKKSPNWWFSFTRRGTFPTIQDGSDVGLYKGDPLKAFANIVSRWATRSGSYQDTSINNNNNNNPLYL